MQLNRTLAYWLSQLFGWLGWGWLLMGSSVLSNIPLLQSLPFSLASTLLGFTLSHSYRILLKPWRWTKFAGLRLLFLGLLSLWVLVGLLYILTYFVIPLIPFSTPIATPYWTSFQGQVVFLVGASIAFGLWLFIYWAVHFVFGYSESRVAQFQLEAGLKSAKLQALESQLNPHFLFNSLNSIAELIGENPTQARYMVLRLSSLLRTTLQTGQTETHPLEKEINLAKTYLELETMRFEERLRYGFDVDMRYQNVPVPVMLIMTLVENSIKHGINRQVQGGEVQIQVSGDANGLLITVTNTGNLENSERPGGVGLANIRERLRLIYGDQAWLSIQDIKPRRVQAMVFLPLRK
ncbi:MAG: histidine kinase [Bacteroidetes Order II. Incertae sedis bacterium]|nr:histidine kinase [Bacteroidetes Order II. bacterium]